MGLPGFDYEPADSQQVYQDFNLKLQQLLTTTLNMTEEMTTNITFKTKTFMFTFGKGNLKLFLTELTNFTDHIITTIDDGPKPWKSIWTTWKQK